MKYNIEMEPEQVNAIIIQELNQTIDGFKRDLALRNIGEGMAIFDCDLEKDVQCIQEYISALQRVVKYYGG